MHSDGIIGTANEVTESLRQLAEQTQTSELFLDCSIDGVEERLMSLELIAEGWGLGTGHNAAHGKDRPWIR